MNIMQPLGKSREYLMKKGISNACLIARLWFYTDDSGKHSPLSPPSEISYFIHDRGKSPASETPWQVSIPDVLSDPRYGTEARFFHTYIGMSEWNPVVDKFGRWHLVSVRTPTNHVHLSKIRVRFFSPNHFIENGPYWKWYFQSNTLLIMPS